MLDHKFDYSLFSNAFGFLRLPLVFNPYCHQNSDWVITGIPFDMATSGRSGSRYGPMAIRQASINLSWEHFRWPWNFDVRERLSIVDCGDLVFQYGNVENFTQTLQHHTECLLNSGKKMLSFGGDHYITLPILRIYSKFFDNLAVIHFDAHTDCYDYNNKYDHGAIMFHVFYEELIDPKRVIQVGIRTEYVKNFACTVLDAEYVNYTHMNIIINQIRSIVKNFPIYITFDIDCLDPSVAPGTGTPVIGGLSSSCALKLIRSLQHLNIVGIDLVEVAPIYDCAQITALTAATLGLEMLYIQAVK